MSEGVDGDAENEEVVEDGEVIPDPTRPRPRASSGDGGLSGGAQQAAPVLGRGRGRGRAQSSPPMRLPQAAVEKPLVPDAEAVTLEAKEAAFWRYFQDRVSEWNPMLW